MSEVLEPKVGERYEVALEDCCIEGSFVATVTAVVTDYGPRHGLLFDNGVRLTNWSGVRFRLHRGGRDSRSGVLG